jgi:pimeloyl-ACP methyl ester carboxylesterase
VTMSVRAGRRPALALLVVLAGCSSVQVRQAKLVVGLRDRAERLVDSHVLSDLTTAVIERDGLSVHQAKHAPGETARALQQLDCPDAARMLAIAELCYRQARKLDDFSPAPSLPWYGDAAAWAARVVATGDPDASEKAINLHNRAVERLVRLSQDFRCRHGRAWPAVFADAGVKLDGVSPFLCPPQFETLTVAQDIFARGMQAWYGSDGFGVPLIAYRANDRENSSDPAARFFPVELRAGATAVMHPSDGGPPTLVFHDPFEEHALPVAGGTVPLAVDRTAALASHVSWAYIQSLARLGLRRSESVRSDTGLNLFRPYQPGKIPVILIHGLRSTPAVAWVQTFNHLQNDPEVAEHYQFWLYFYPTGAPLAANAARLRADLRAALATFDPGGTDPALRQMVLCGHSMGGLIAKMAAQDSGSAVWDSVFSRPPDQLCVSDVSRQQLVEALFFHPEPSVGRLVFIATPHRGSERPNGPLGRVIESKISRDDPFTAAVKEAKRRNGRDVLAPDVNVKRLDGVGGLRPGDPILTATADLPIDVPYNSIMPLLGAPDSILGTDLAVRYRSSHIDGADSEFIFHGIHTSTDQPPVATELRRILLEHLAAVCAASGPGVGVEIGPQPDSGAAETRRPLTVAQPVGRRTGVHRIGDP